MLRRGVVVDVALLHQLPDEIREPVYAHLTGTDQDPEVAEPTLRRAHPDHRPDEQVEDHAKHECEDVDVAHRGLLRK